MKSSFFIIFFVLVCNSCYKQRSIDWLPIITKDRQFNLKNFQKLELKLTGKNKEEIIDFVVESIQNYNGRTNLSNIDHTDRYGIRQIFIIFLLLFEPQKGEDWQSVDIWHIYREKYKKLLPHYPFIYQNKTPFFLDLEFSIAVETHGTGLNKIIDFVKNKCNVKNEQINYEEIEKNYEALLQSEIYKKIKDLMWPLYLTPPKPNYR